MKNLEMAYLMDFYGNLLNEKQQGIMRLYYQEDLSLSEIAEEYGITRQGVRDNIVRAEKELKGCESALGLWAKFSRITSKLSEIEEIAENSAGLEKAACDKIKSLVSEIENDI